MAQQDTLTKSQKKTSVSLIEYRALLAEEKTKSSKSPQARNGKYNAIRTEYAGISFDSKGECERYKELALLQSLGQISDLKLKIVHKLSVNDIHICSYESDFEYLDHSGFHVVEDYKGFRTKEFIIKSKLMLALKGVAILETGTKTDKGGHHGRKSPASKR